MSTPITQWECDGCGQLFSTHHIAVECSDKHRPADTFKEGDLVGGPAGGMHGVIIRVETKRDTFFRALVEYDDGTRQWLHNHHLELRLYE